MIFVFIVSHYIVVIKYIFDLLGKINNKIKNGTYNEFIEKNKDILEGVDTNNVSEVAKAIARESADKTFRFDYYNSIFDIGQLVAVRNLAFGGFLKNKKTPSGRRYDINARKYAGKYKTKEELKELPNNEGFEIYLELDPVTGGYNYRFQMQTMSKLDKLPVFDYIHLTYTLTPDLELKHLTANEKYKATMLGISPDIVNTLEYEYFPNQLTEIPEVTQDINYYAFRELRK